MFDFFKNYKDDPKMYRAMLYTRYSAARMNLLLVVIFSVLNIITLMMGTGQLLFTAAIPYKIVEVGRVFCGFCSDEYYKQTGITPLFDKPLIALFIAIALLIITLVLLCWLFSKRRGAEKWLGFALALMSADTMVAFLFGNPSTMLVDIIFHLLIIVLLFSGIGAYKKLRTLPRDDEPEEEYTEEEYTEEEYEEEAPARESRPARPAGSASSNASLEMKIIKPERYEDVTGIAQHLLHRRTDH